MQLAPDMKPAFTPLRRIGPVVEGGSVPGSTGDVSRFIGGRRKSMMDYDKPRGASSFQQTYKKISGQMGVGTSTTVGSGLLVGAQAQSSGSGNLDDMMAALDIGIGLKPRSRSGSQSQAQSHSPRISQSEKS